MFCSHRREKEWFARKATCLAAFHSFVPFEHFESGCLSVSGYIAARIEASYEVSLWD
jgi:hypothetical protein